MKFLLLLHAEEGIHKLKAVSEMNFKALVVFVTTGMRLEETSFYFILVFFCIKRGGVNLVSNLSVTYLVLNHELCQQFRQILYFPVSPCEFRFSVAVCHSFLLLSSLLLN